jgi:hypothetical protein
MALSRENVHERVSQYCEIEVFSHTAFTCGTRLTMLICLFYVYLHRCDHVIGLHGASWGFLGLLGECITVIDGLGVQEKRNNIMPKSRISFQLNQIRISSRIRGSRSLMRTRTKSSPI